MCFSLQSWTTTALPVALRHAAGTDATAPELGSGRSCRCEPCRRRRGRGGGRRFRILRLPDGRVRRQSIRRRGQRIRHVVPVRRGGRRRRSSRYVIRFPLLFLCSLAHFIMPRAAKVVCYVSLRGD